jgi:glutathione S-transferase
MTGVKMEYSIIIILLALVQYQFFGLRTGVTRPKYKVPPPKTVGDETWERIYRVHQNTLEQLIVFIPGLLLFSYYVSSRWAILPGLLYLIFRQYYSHMYIKNPPNRTFPPTFFVNGILVVGSLIGVIASIMKQ